MPAGKAKGATAKPTKQGRRLLKGAKKLAVTVELKPKGGGKVTKKLKLKA